LAAFLIGLALFIGRQRHIPHDRTVEITFEKKSPEGNPAQVEDQSSKDGGEPSAAALPLRKEPLLNRAGDEKTARGSGQPIAPKNAVTSSPKARSQNVVDSKVSAPPPRKAPVEPPRDARALTEKEADLESSRNRGPGPVSESPTREPAARETEEAEPGRAIDWLLEKRERNSRFFQAALSEETRIPEGFVRSGPAGTSPCATHVHILNVLLTFLTLATLVHFSTR